MKMWKCCHRFIVSERGGSGHVTDVSSLTYLVPHIAVYLIYVPPSLVIVVVVLILGFLLSLAGFMRRRKEEASYQKIPNGEPAGSGGVARGVTAVAVAQSYQNSAVTTEYALPMEQKVVAYFVIDGRLVDSNLTD